MVTESQELLDMAIEQLKDTIAGIAYSIVEAKESTHVYEDGLICERCIDTIHALLGILDLLSPDEDDYTKYILGLIGLDA